MKQSVLFAVLPLFASALVLEGKPPKKVKLDAVWMTATVEDAENVKASPSVAPFRPQFEILNTEHEVGHSKTVEVYWQRPNTTEVKGIFFGATGCFHQAGDFFEEKAADGWEFAGCKKSKLSRCQGLPENVYAFNMARQRGYLVATINPQGPNSCWDHKLDPARLDTAIKYIIKKEGLPSDVPMFATGASQGGIFLFDMQAEAADPKILPNLKCLAPQCAGPKQTFSNAHLPTIFIWMPKDFNVTVPVINAIKKLRKKGVRVSERTPHPWKIQDLMVARGYSNETAAKMLDQFLKIKGPYKKRPVARNGFLSEHPGSDGYWKKAARKVLSEKEDSLLKDHSKFHQILQVAYAEHEWTAEYTDHILDFCENHEDPKAPLRFAHLGREPIIKGPSQFALSCSPNCPRNGGGEMFMQKAEVVKKAAAPLGFDQRKKLEPVKH